MTREPSENLLAAEDQGGGQLLAAEDRDGGRVPRILAFETHIGGHHPSYIRNIARLWAQRQLPAQLEFLVTPAFFDAHPDVVQEVREKSPDWIQISAITKAEHQQIEGAGWKRVFDQGWKTFCRYAKEKQADHGLLMYSDHFQLPLLFGPTSPCPLSCVYFRPTFHYSPVSYTHLTLPTKA